MVGGEGPWGRQGGVRGVALGGGGERITGDGGANGRGGREGGGGGWAGAGGRGPSCGGGGGEAGSAAPTLHLSALH